jgi:hypothetical protein
MNNVIRTGLVVLTTAAAVFSADVVVRTSGAEAAKGGPYSARVRRSCKSDYNRFCPGYSLYGTEIRRCMQAAGKAISKRCIRALVDAGEVPRSLLKQGY